jgi:nucleoside-diphosphate-sugar epimerase
MRCVVTGSAGFIGSHLCEALLLRGHTVHGIDCFTNFYPASLKARNQSHLLAHPQYHFHGLDLRRDDLHSVVSDVDVIFHLAAMPGLSRSWSDFSEYLSCNVAATERLIDVAKHSTGLKRFIYSSTASVYGSIATGGEDTPPHPISPYGVTKLAAEQLCRAHAEASDLPLVTLRFFTVYGPRQRPDMAYHQFFQAHIEDRPIIVYGEGQQRRGATYVLDCVNALIAAIDAPKGELYNVGGDQSVSVRDVLKCMERVTGITPKVEFAAARLGDQQQTLADTSKIYNHLGWRPQTKLEEGLTAQWNWHSEQNPKPARPYCLRPSNLLTHTLN